MSESVSFADLSDRQVLIPGGTGGVGEGAVRAYLAAGAQVVVPTRSADRAAEFRALLGQDATERLHLFEHGYTSFAGAEELVARRAARWRGRCPRTDRRLVARQAALGDR